MTKKEQLKTIKELENYKKEVTSSLDSAKKFLIRTGIHTKNNKLSKAYK
jgi:hypothetical protein